MVTVKPLMFSFIVGKFQPAMFDPREPCHFNLIDAPEEDTTDPADETWQSGIRDKIWKSQGLLAKTVVNPIITMGYPYWV